MTWRRPVDVTARLRVDVADDVRTYWVELEAADGQRCRLDLATARQLATQVQNKLRVAERMAAGQAQSSATAAAATSPAATSADD